MPLMKRKRIGVVIAFAAVAMAACAGGDEKSAGPGTAEVHVVATETGRPDISIESYSVITADRDRELPMAAEVMEIKKLYPQAMRRKDRAIFEQILARGFTFRGVKDFFNRQDYIDNRTQGPVTDWSVKYHNLVLQFVGERCLVTYRNVVTGKNDDGTTFTEFMTWADVYIREGGRWKIEAVHLIDYREEITNASSAP